MKKMKSYKAGSFPDKNGDNKTTQADIFLQKKENGTIKKKGGYKMKEGGTKKKKKKKMASPARYQEGGFLEPGIERID